MFLILLAIVAFMFILSPSLTLAGIPLVVGTWALMTIPASVGIWIILVVLGVAILTPAKYWPEFDMEKAL